MKMKGLEMNKYRKMLEDLFEKAELKEKAKDLHDYILRTKDIKGIDDVNHIRRLMERSGMIEPREYAFVKLPDRSTDMGEKSSEFLPTDDTKSVMESTPAFRNDVLQNNRSSDNPNVMSDKTALQENRMNANNQLARSVGSEGKQVSAIKSADNGGALSDEDYRMVLAYLKNHLG